MSQDTPSQKRSGLFDCYHGIGNAATSFLLSLHALVLTLWWGGVVSVELADTLMSHKRVLYARHYFSTLEEVEHPRTLF